MFKWFFNIFRARTIEEKRAQQLAECRDSLLKYQLQRDVSDGWCKAMQTIIKRLEKEGVK